MGIAIVSTLTAAPTLGPRFLTFIHIIVSYHGRIYVRRSAVPPLQSRRGAAVEGEALGKFVSDLYKPVANGVTPSNSERCYSGLALSEAGQLDKYPAVVADIFLTIVFIVALNPRLEIKAGSVSSVSRFNIRPPQPPLDTLSNSLLSRDPSNRSYNTWQKF